MDISINSTEEKFYQQALRIVSHIPPFNKLRTKELEVFAWLSYYYNKLKITLGESRINEINDVLFEYDNKAKIREKVKDRTGSVLSSENLANLMMSLKRKGFIIEKEGKKFLNTKYLFDPKRVDSITYKFHFNE